jgi:hypothetical protein
VNATALGGEVDALEPGAYGSFAINQAVTIEGQGWSYIAPPENGYGIYINAGSGNVAIHGVSLNGVGTTGATGIAFASGSSLTIEDSTIRNFSGSGIALAPISSATIAVSRTLVAGNGGHGIYLQPNGRLTVHAIFNRVEAYQNVQKGIGIFGNLDGLPIDAVIVDSIAANNADGIYVLGNGFFNSVSLRVNHSTTYANGTGLHAEGSAAVFASQSDLNEPTSPWLEDSNSCILTYGDNYTYNNPPVCSFPAFQKY